MDALEDSAEEHLWQWELRDQKVPSAPLFRPLRSPAPLVSQQCVKLCCCCRRLPVWVLCLTRVPPSPARRMCCYHWLLSLTRVTSLLPVTLHLPQVLPKELRLAAQQAKRRAARVQERLVALGAALRLLGAHPGGRAGAKLNRALDALQKSKVRPGVCCVDAATSASASSFTAGLTQRWLST